MRIVSGQFKGRRLSVPVGRDIRPTSDRARQAVFNVIEHAEFAPKIKGASVIDVCAGTGAMGLEALSRGATKLTAIDADPDALALVRKNAGTLGQALAVTMLRLDATKLPPPPKAALCPASIAFIDPPYGLALAAPILLSLAGRGWVGQESLIVLETAAKEPFEPPRGFQLIDQRRYGAAMVSFLKLAA